MSRSDLRRRAAVVATATAALALSAMSAAASDGRAGRVLFAPPAGAPNAAPPAGAEAPRPEARPYEGDRVVRVRVRSLADSSRVQLLSGDVWSHGVEPGGFLTARFDEAAYARLVESGLEHEVIVEDLQRVVDEGRAANEAARDQAAAMDGDGFFLAYRELAEIEERLEQLAASHPEIVQPAETIGLSYEGRPILGYTIAGPGGAEDRPALAINAACHAREWISPAATLFALSTLVEDYGSDARATAVLDAVRIHYVPVANPDGYVHTWDDQRLWRKTRNDNGDGSFGTDWNRNFSTGWGGPGSSGDPGSQIYRGPEPFSTPEASAFRDYVLAQENVVAHLDIHSFGQLVLWPRGYEASIPPEPLGGNLVETGRALADVLTANEGRRYTPQPAHDLYLASGIATDWAFEAAGALSWTLELRPGSSQAGGFIIPPTEIVPTGTEVRDAIETLAEAAAGGFVVRFPEGVPQVIDPTNTAAPARLRVRIRALEEDGIDASTARLLWRTGPADDVETLELEPFGGDLVAFLDGLPCGESIELAVAVDHADGSVRTWPRTFPDDALRIDAAAPIVRQTFDFEDAPGWIVQSNPGTLGTWERGVPADDGGDGDPVLDFDGSGACWLTGNQPGNSDVDGGPTRLTSPPLAIATLDEPHLRFAAWLRNDDLDQDRLLVEVSGDDGASWQVVDALYDGIGWRVREVPLRPFVGDAETVRVRFSVADAPNNSLTEAGIDALAILERGCPNGADVNGDGTVDLADLLLVLAAWGPCENGVSCPGDADGDGSVGMADLELVLGG